MSGAKMPVVPPITPETSPTSGPAYVCAREEIVGTRSSRLVTAKSRPVAPTARAIHRGSSVPSSRAPAIVPAMTPSSSPPKRRRSSRVPPPRRRMAKFVAITGMAMSRTALRAPIRLAAMGTEMSGKPNPSALFTAAANVTTMSTAAKAAFRPRAGSPSVQGDLHVGGRARRAAGDVEASGREILDHRDHRFHTLFLRQRGVGMPAHRVRMAVVIAQDRHDRLRVQGPAPGALREQLVHPLGALIG